MKSICLYFQVHQPLRLRRYRFFDIGNDHYYYDDYTNESIIRKIADNCYLPANQVLLDLIKKYKGEFKVSFSITGIALDQFELYTPEVIKSFKELAKTGQVEFLAETYSHSLVSLINKDEFVTQVKEHHKKIVELFGQKPVTFRNTELVYSDAIGELVSSMGYQAILTEGAKHILGWKSPNFVYCNAINPKLKVLLRNYKLSDDITFKFNDRGWSEWPLTAEKYVDWLNNIEEKEEVINLFMDYETFGEHQKSDTGIFEFLKAFPGQVLHTNKFKFSTPKDVSNELQPISAIHAPYPISWADEERDLTAWLGNYMQDEAFNKLYLLKDMVSQTKDKNLLKDWRYLQASDHFYYMCTKFFSDGAIHSYFNPYNSPYDAFINYMNVLSDFTEQLKEATDKNISELKQLKKLLNKKDKQLIKFEEELKKLKTLNVKIKQSTKVKKIIKSTTKPKKSPPVKKNIAVKKKNSVKKGVKQNSSAKQ